jgi:hypothetical protein
MSYYVRYHYTATIPGFLAICFKISIPGAFPFHRIAYHSFFLCPLRLNRERAAISLALHQSRNESATLPLIGLVSVGKLRYWKTWQRKIGIQLWSNQLFPNAPQHTFSRDEQSDNRNGSRHWNTGPYEILAVGTDIRELFLIWFLSLFFCTPGSTSVFILLIVVLSSSIVI